MVVAVEREEDDRGFGEKGLVRKKVVVGDQEEKKKTGQKQVKKMKAYAGREGIAS